MKEQIIIIDTNLIFSALLSSQSKIRDILFDNNFKFYAPNYLISEIYLHKEKLIKLSKLDEENFYLIFNGIIDKINFISLDFISN